MIKIFYLLFTVFIGLPSLVVFIIFEDYLALMMCILLVTAFLGFYIGAGFGYEITHRRELDFSISKQRIITFLMLCFIFTYLLMFYEFGGVPLFQSGSVDNTSILRAEFTKSKAGLLGALTYFKSVFSKGILPIVTCWMYLFLPKKRFYIVLIMISFLLLSAFEKAGLIWVYIPLFVLQLNYKRYKEFYISSAIALILTTFVSMLSLTHLASNTTYEKDKEVFRTAGRIINYNLKSELEEPVAAFKYDYGADYSFNNVNLYEQEEQYQFLLTFGDQSDPILFMVNRIVWIPFITAYDTLLFWQLNYTEHLSFGVNRYFASFLGYEFADLERRVFRFQFGSGIESTGNSNASFIAEAYIGFGYFGVFIFSCFFGVVVGTLIKGDVLVFISIIPIMYFSILSGSLISSFFSGGFLFIIILFYILTRKRI